MKMLTANDERIGIVAGDRRWGCDRVGRWGLRHGGLSISNTLDRKILTCQGSDGMVLDSTATDRHHDFQAVAILQGGLGMSAARHDFAIAFHSHALAAQGECLDQAADADAGRKLFRLAVDADLDHGWVAEFSPWLRDAASPMSGTVDMNTCQNQGRRS